MILTARAALWRNTTLAFRVSINTHTHTFSFLRQISSTPYSMSRQSWHLPTASQNLVCELRSTLTPKQHWNVQGCRVDTLASRILVHTPYLYSEKIRCDSVALGLSGGAAWLSASDSSVTAPSTAFLWTNKGRCCLHHHTSMILYQARLYPLWQRLHNVFDLLKPFDSK